MKTGLMIGIILLFNLIPCASIALENTNLKEFARHQIIPFPPDNPYTLGKAAFVSGEALFDRWVNGDKNLMRESAKNGFQIFTGKGQCVQCDSGWNFTDGKFYDIDLFDKDEGFGALTGLEISRQSAHQSELARSSIQSVVEEISIISGMGTQKATSASNQSGSMIDLNNRVQNISELADKTHRGYDDILKIVAELDLVSFTLQNRTSKLLGTR